MIDSVVETAHKYRHNSKHPGPPDLDWLLPRWEPAAGCSSQPSGSNEPVVTDSTELSPPPGSGKHRLDSLTRHCSSVKKNDT